MNAPNGDGTTNYWANDGSTTGEPAASVVVTVSGGLFMIMLGDVNLPRMTQPITQAVFAATDTYLRVWFGQTAQASDLDQLRYGFAGLVGQVKMLEARQQQVERNTAALMAGKW